MDMHAAERMIGRTAYANDGSKIGSIDQLYLDDATGEPTWVSITTGLFGTSQSLAPLSDATTTDDGVRLAYPKGVVKDAPRVDADRHLDEPEQDALVEYYRGHGWGRDADRRHDAVHADTDDLAARRPHADVDEDVSVGDSATVTRSEERLRVGTEQVEAGRVRLRKYTTTEEQTVTVPVTTERLRVERTPVAEGTTVDPIADTGEVVEEIVLKQERPVVSKETVAVEQVSVGKEAVTQDRQVTESVRKEHVDIDGDDVPRSER